MASVHVATTITRPSVITKPDMICTVATRFTLLLRSVKAYFAPEQNEPPRIAITMYTLYVMNLKHFSMHQSMQRRQQNTTLTAVYLFWTAFI